MTETVSTRRVQRIRHETRPRRVVVSRSEAISPNFVAITFSGEDLADFSSEGFDDHIKFILPDGTDTPPRRDYTPRRFDRARRELTIEFLLHGHGLASEWARTAGVGAAAVIGGPKNSMVIPADYPWHLLVGDATALPAVHRRLEELPAGVRAIVRIQLDDARDRRPLETAADLDLQWLSAGANLARVVRELQLPGTEGFAWCGCEAAQAIRVRHVLIDERRHPHEAMRVSNYWHAEGAGH
jgi:NADPH-dependent ferric siderophore reductase